MNVDPVELHAKIRDLHHVISISSSFDDSKRVAEALASSEQSFNKWRNTWLLGTSDLTANSERLWGKDGWVMIQDMLAEMVETIKLLEDARKDTEVGSDRAKVGRKLNWRAFMSRLKEPQVLNSKSLYDLHVALALGQVIERLWIHSEMLFESLHDTSTPKHGSSLRDREVSRSVSVRQGAVALYEACHRSTKRCELGLDLLRDCSMPVGPDTTPHPAIETSIFYQIFLRSENNPGLNKWDITVESLHGPKAAAVSPAVKVHEEPDLSVFESNPPSSSHTIGIQPSYSRENYYFRVTTAHATAGSLSKNESSGLPFKSNTIPTEAGTSHSRALMAKLDLAYNLAQCSFYLLGTPWLAGLSSKSLRTIDTKDRKVSVLDVLPMPLDDLFFLDRDGLSEISQLLRLGIILIDIALDSLDTSDTARLDNPHLYASKRLPLVHEAMGSNYYRACASCVLERRSFPSYGL